MALRNKWWFPHAVILSCLVCIGSCNSDSREEARPEHPIFKELCALKKAEGNCRATKDRFYFDIDTGNCESFQYGGCGGNDNNFETMEACKETCVVTADKSPCHLPESPGPCRGLLLRYFYDSESQGCKRFFYGGCYGNANNFKTVAACQARCQNPVNTTTRTPNVAITNPTSKSSTRPLKVIEVSSFNEPQVRPVARPRPTGFTPPEFCLSPIVRGTCDGTERRFAFHPRTKRCHMFHYSGCGGNKNSFPNRRQCMKTCMNVRNKDPGMKIRIKKKNMNNNIIFHAV